MNGFAPFTSNGTSCSARYLRECKFHCHARHCSAQTIIDRTAHARLYVYGKERSAPAIPPSVRSRV
ncbi:MAG: hypothetical protein MZV64_23660 [Ignavibacteriales bacterium]|nr:hypothetical protein [Ignavibacteriales bacterium]